MLCNPRGSDSEWIGFWWLKSFFQNLILSGELEIAIVMTYGFLTVLALLVAIFIP